MQMLVVQEDNEQKSKKKLAAGRSARDPPCLCAHAKKPELDLAVFAKISPGSRRWRHFQKLSVTKNIGRTDKPSKSSWV